MLFSRHGGYLITTLSGEGMWTSWNASSPGVVAVTNQNRPRKARELRESHEKQRFPKHALALQLEKLASPVGGAPAQHVIWTCGLWCFPEFPCLYLEGKGSRGLLSCQTLESRQNPGSSFTKPHSMVYFAVHASSLGFKRSSSHRCKQCRTIIFFFKLRALKLESNLFKGHLSPTCFCSALVM